MSKQRTRGLIGSVLGLENEEGEAVLDGNPTPDTPDVQIVVEVEPLSTEGTEAEATAEVIEGEAEVTEVADEVETMAENVEALEALAADLQQAIADGGMTPQTAVMFNRAHGAIAGRHLNMSKRVLAAESFGSASSRLRATEAAHESVVESIKSFLKGIVEFVKKIVAKVVAWFKSVFTAKGRLAVRLKNLEGAIASMGSELKDKAKKVAFPSGLTLGGKAVEAGALTKALGGCVIEDGNFKPDEKFGEKVKKVVDDIKGADLADKLAAADAASFFLQLAAHGSSNEGKFDASGLGQSQVGVAISDELPGSKVVVATFPKTGSAAHELSISTLLGTIDLKIVDSAEKLKMADKLETGAWSSSELVSLLNVTKEVAENKKWSADKSVETISKAIDAVLGDLIKTADKAGDENKKLAANARSLATGLQGVMSRVGRGYMQVESYAFQRAQLSANLIAAHVKAYK